MKRSTYLLNATLALYACALLPSAQADVVLHYSFDSDYQDSSDNANHGVLFDSSDDGSAVIAADAAVFGGGGMTQGHKDDRVDLTTPFTPADGTPWTIAFWADLIGGAASYGFNSSIHHSVQARADSESSVNIWVAGQKYTFDSASVVSQNSQDNHFVIVAHPIGIDLDGVAGDDKFAVYANGQRLMPDPGQDLTDASVSTAIEVTQLGDSAEWPHGSAGNYDEFWILDEALTANAVHALYTKNYPHELWFVDADTDADSVDQDGFTWDTAFEELYDALDVAGEGAMIWVADGIYYPVSIAGPGVTEAERAFSFNLKSGQQLHGGFKGDETSIERSFNSNRTVLSGDLGEDDGMIDIAAGFTGENSFRVVMLDGAEDCVINGVTITQGGDITKTGGGLAVIDATMVTVESCVFSYNIGRDGGGVWLDSTAALFVDCEFESNYAEYNAGALFVNSSSSDNSPELDVIDCRFDSNISLVRGGAIMTTYTDYTLERCQFTANTSNYGGASRFYRSNGSIVNTFFAGNSATTGGGALYHDSGGSMGIKHVTFYDNTATVDGHHIYTTGNSAHNMLNTVMWYGATLPVSGSAFYNEFSSVNYTNSLVQGVDLSGVGSDDLDGTLASNDPEFTDPDGHDYTVRAYSPLVNAGAEIAGIELDLAGVNRLVGAAVDIGCFEHESPFEVTPLLAYDSTKIGDTYPAFDFIDALDSEDDALIFNSTDSSVVSVAHPMDDDEVMVEVGELTVVGLGTANVVFNFQYQGGAVHQFIQPVQVSPQALESRDLSSLVDVSYLVSDFDVSQDYADLSVVFEDSPDSFSVLSADTNVFTVSESFGDVDIVPVGYGQANLTLRAHYNDGTVLEVVRIVSVSLSAGAQAAADAVDDQGFGINGEASSVTYADLSVFLAEGGSSIAVSSSDESVFAVSESSGVITVTPLAVGSADITIELISSGGERYTIEKTLRVLDHDGHLLAQYLLDGDATDAQGNYDGSVSVDGVVWSLDDVVIGEAGVLEAPDALTQDLFAIDGSFQLDLNFKIETADEDGVKVLAGIQQGDSSVTEDGGIMLLYTESAGLVNIYLSYSDGVNLNDRDYEFEKVGQCIAAHWYSLRLVFDFDLDLWTVKIEDHNGPDLFNAPFEGPINNKADYEYDIEAFKNILSSNSLRFGAFYSRNTQDELEESEVRIDDVFVYSPAQAWYPNVNAALDALTDHVTNTQPLAEETLDAHLATLEEQLSRTSFSKVQMSVEAFMQAYEANNPAIFESSTLVTPAHLDPVMQAMIVVQQWVHNTAFVPETLDLVSDYVFEAGEAFPGSVAATEPRVVSATVTADGNYATDPAALMIWADTVLRPLGYYVPAGETVTISVDPAYTALGLEIVVGAHSRNLDESKKPAINRFRDITTEFSLDQSTITVANAFGGGLYLRIPDGTSAGEIPLTIEGAVKSAYFSTREGKETDVAAWLLEVANSEVPWVDFESDKFMFTVPLSLAQSVTQPDLVMDRWDEIMDQYRYMNGRPLDNRIRAEYYLLDRMLVTPAWGAGYPLVVPIGEASSQDSNWNPLNVLTVAPNRTLFHEFGHNCAIPGPTTNPETRVLADLSVKELPSWAEGENLVNIPAFIVYNRVYGDSVVDAFSQATFQSLSIDQAAYDWMITENFRSNRPIGFDTSGVYDLNSNVAIDELRYQARGIGRYGDLVQLFGWEGVNLIHSEFYPIRLEDQATPTGKQHRLLRDAFIRRASEALQVNMSPLLHFWGIQPSASLQAELASYPKSLAIKEKLEYYLSLAPETRSAFDSIITEISPGAGSYSEQRYDYYQGYVTDADAQSIGDQIELILSEYGLDAAEAIFNLKLRHRPDGRVAMEWTNDDQAVDHFVIRMKAAGAVVATELGASDSTDFVTSVLGDGAYTFSVAGVYADGTETLPRELSVASLPTYESVAVLLNDAVFIDGSGFVGSGLSTEYLAEGTGGSGGTGGTGGLDIKQGSSLKVSAAAILDYIQYEAGDQSIGYEEVQLDSIVLVVPSAFESGPSVVKVWVDDTPTYNAYAGGINTIGPVRSFNLGEQELDITAMYSLEEDEDFYFFLFNSVQNNESTQQNAYLRIEFTVTGGYRQWYEEAGLEPGVDAETGDDADGDGVTNFVEFALGRDPTQAGEGALTQIGEGYDADELNIRFIRGQDAVRYRIEMTEDLGDWFDATVVWDSEVDFMTVVDPGEEQVVPVSLDDDTARFYRLTVEENYEEDVLN